MCLFSAFSVNFGAKLGDILSETLTTCGGFAENCLTAEAYDFLRLSGIFFSRNCEWKISRVCALKISRVSEWLRTGT